MIAHFTPIHHLLKDLKASKPSLPAEPIPPAQMQGSPRKEAEPGLTVAQSVENQPVEYQQPEIVEAQPEAPTTPMIEVRPEVPTVPTDLQQIGVTPTPMYQSMNVQNIPLPMSEEKLPQGLHAPVTTSFRWLSELTLYVLKSSYRGVKTFHQNVYGVFGNPFRFKK